MEHSKYKLAIKARAGMVGNDQNGHSDPIISMEGL